MKKKSIREGHTIIKRDKCYYVIDQQGERVSECLANRAAAESYIQNGPGLQSGDPFGQPLDPGMNLGTGTPTQASGTVN